MTAADAYGSCTLMYGGQSLCKCRLVTKPAWGDFVMDPFPVGVNTNWSNTWKHACYCAFMYTFTEKHVCFHVTSLFSAHFWPHWKRVHLVSQAQRCGILSKAEGKATNLFRPDTFLLSDILVPYWEEGLSESDLTPWKKGHTCLCYSQLVNTVIAQESTHLHVSAHPPFFDDLSFIPYMYKLLLRVSAHPCI